MIKTGEILRKAREEKGFSLNEVALSLKISSRILKAIEDGDEAKLPAKTFLRGFVQSYAAYLRLDVDQVMTTFLEEVGSTTPKPLIKTNETQRSADGTESVSQEAQGRDHLAPINQKSNTKTILVIVIGIILVGLIVFTKRMIDKYTREAQVESPVTISEPLTDSSLLATSEVAEEEATNMSMAAEATPAPTVTPRVPVATATPVAVATPAASPSPTVVATPSPTPIPKPTPTQNSSPTPTASPSPTVTPTPEKPTMKSVELIIEALDNVVIEYSSNAGKQNTLKLNAEQMHTFKSKNGLKLSISNGGAVNLILNGRDLGIPGDLGKAISLSY